MGQGSVAALAPHAPDQAPTSRLRRVQAVVNAASGSVGAGAAQALDAILKAHGINAEIANVPPKRIAEAVRGAIAARPDLVVVLAGDGTANLAANLAGPDGPLIAPLPGGTMNLLPHALYGVVPWREALDLALTKGVDRPISGGSVGGASFYVAAILGAPALFADAREALRARRFGLAIARARRALSSAFAHDLRYRLEDAPEETAEALVLLCPLVSRALEEDGVLEAAVLNPRDAGEVVRLGLAAAQGRWRDDPSVAATPCARGAAAAGRRRLRAVLDGEPHRLDPEVEFHFVQKAFRALAPPCAGAAGVSAASGAASAAAGPPSTSSSL